MPRIVGVDIPEKKKIEYALCFIHGVGLPAAKKIISLARIDPSLQAKELNKEQISKINQILEQSFKVEGELRRVTRDNIKRLIDIGAYRGLRHKKGLPVRGQRTRHNARTRKGKKKTIGGISVRKPASKT